MCGRYTVDEENPEMARILREIQHAYPDAKLKTGEIYPTNTAPILTGSHAEPIPAAWGFPAYTGKGVIINARSETAQEKKTFRNCLEFGRCIVPTTGYFEWSEQKDKYRFRLPGRELLFLAGLCRKAEETVQYVILTAPANASVSPVHHRIPLILTDEAVGFWLNDTASARNYLHAQMPSLVFEKE